jgi:hypothetical protein
MVKATKEMVKATKEQSDQQSTNLLMPELDISATSQNTNNAKKITTRILDLISCANVFQRDVKRFIKKLVH